MNTLSKSREKLFTTAKDRDFFLKAFGISHEEWSVLTYNYGILTVELNHPFNDYVLKTTTFWNYYTAVIADLEIVFIHMVHYENSVKHIAGREKKDKDYCLGLLYVKAVKDFRIPQYLMSLINKEYEQNIGKIKPYRIRKKEALNKV